MGHAASRDNRSSRRIHSRMLICVRLRVVEAHLDTTVRSRRESGRLQFCTTYQAGHSYGQSNTQPPCCLMISLRSVRVLVTTSTCMVCYCKCDMSVGSFLPKYTSQMSTVDLHVLEATTASPENVRVWNHGLGSHLGRSFEHDTGNLCCC